MSEMVRNFKIVVLLTGALFFSNLASAELHIEPYLGYHSTTNTFSTTGLDLDGSTSGTAYGFLFGSKTGSWTLGLDYSILSGSWSGDAAFDGSVTATDLGLFVAYRFEGPWRFSFSYYLNSQLKYNLDNGTFYLDDDGSGTNRSTHDKASFYGTGLKLGAGYQFLSYLVVNFEYLIHTYNYFGSVDLSSPGLDKYKNTSMMLMLNFPLGSGMDSTASL